MLACSQCTLQQILREEGAERKIWNAASTQRRQACPYSHHITGNSREQAEGTVRDTGSVIGENSIPHLAPQTLASIRGGILL